MDDAGDGSRYSFRPKPPIRNPHPYSMTNHYTSNVGFAQKDDQFEDDEDNPQFNNAYYQHSYYEEQSKSDKRKRKMQPLDSNYELAPKSMNLGGTSRDSWNEEGSYVLLEVWGERYLELGRRSLRAEDWVEVAEKVSEMSGAERTEMECRHQMDVLKKKYKKERAKMESVVGGGFVSKWVFFKKMDVLLNLRMRGNLGLGCGVDSGEYVFMNPRVYLDKSNVLDEMRDSPGVSDEEENGEAEEMEGRGGGEHGGESAKLLADSIHRFGEIYEKIESTKRRQMMELEKMRRDFQKEMELQKQQIVEKAQEEIAKIREADEEEEEEEEDDTDDEHDDDPVEDGEGGDDVDDNEDEENAPNESIHG